MKMSRHEKAIRDALDAGDKELARLNRQATEIERNYTEGCRQKALLEKLLVAPADGEVLPGGLEREEDDAKE